MKTEYTTMYSNTKEDNHKNISELQGKGYRVLSTVVTKLGNVKTYCAVGMIKKS